MSAVTRIYLVTNGTDERLVEAENQSKAERHVSAPIKASLATQVQLVNLVRAGVQIERAGEKAENPQGPNGGGGRADQQLGDDAE